MRDRLTLMRTRYKVLKSGIYDSLAGQRNSIKSLLSANCAVVACTEWHTFCLLFFYSSRRLSRRAGGYVRRATAQDPVPPSSTRSRVCI